MSFDGRSLRRPHESPQIYFMFLESRIIDLHFATGSLCLSSFKFFWWAPQEFSISIWCQSKVRFGRSRSSKVDKFGTNRKRVCDFLLVRNSNFAPILHRFGDLTAFMCYWPPPLFNPNFGGVPVAPHRRCWASTSARTLSYLAVKLFSKKSNLCENHTSTSQTDRQTDGRTTYCRITALCASIAR